MLAGDINQMKWRKSSASASEGCVEVAAVRKAMLVRDSKNELGPMLEFSNPEWMQFLIKVRRSDLNHS